MRRASGPTLTEPNWALARRPIIETNSVKESDVSKILNSKKIRKKKRYIYYKEGKSIYGMAIYFDNSLAFASDLKRK